MTAMAKTTLEFTVSGKTMREVVNDGLQVAEEHGIKEKDVMELEVEPYLMTHSGAVASWMVKVVGPKFTEPTPKLESI